MSTTDDSTTDEPDESTPDHAVTASDATARDVDANPYADITADEPADALPAPSDHDTFSASSPVPPVAPPQTVTSLPADAPYTSAVPSGQIVRHDAPSSDVPNEVFIGDLSVTRDAVRSPQGVIPTRDTQIQVHNRTYMTGAIPTWAIVVTVVGFFIISVFSLLFLLVKEQRFAGGYEVVATGPGGTLTSFIPVTQQNAGFVWGDLQMRADLARKVIAAE